MTIALVPLDDLREAPSNVKAHDVDLVVESLRRFGFADPPVVDQRTGLLLAGHGRTAALRRMRDAGEPPPDGIEPDGWQVPVFAGWSSRDDAEADAARVALNRTTESGGWDDAALYDLLGRLSEVDDGLTGTGYVEQDLILLRSRLHGLTEGDPPPVDPYEEWDGMPGYEHEDQTSYASCRVHFRSEEDRRAFATLIGQEFTDKTKSVWYPAAEVAHVSHLAFVHEDHVPEHLTDPAEADA